MITRLPRKTTYTIIPNEILNDERLDWKELGLLCYLLSKPDNWKTHPNHLIKQKKTGRDGLYTILKSLQKYGYMWYERHSDGATAWFVTEKPHTEKPDREKPHQEKPHVLVSTELKVITERDKKTLVGKPDYLSQRKTIISYLNNKAGFKFQPNAKLCKQHIDARLNEGKSIEDFMLVIDSKFQEWWGDSRMQKSIRPQTLFGTKFDDYLGAAHIPQPDTRTGAQILMDNIGHDYEQANNRLPAIGDQRNMGQQVFPAATGSPAYHSAALDEDSSPFHS